jgi:hypothetical protein
MIQEFTVKNFRSFKDKVTLSFEATKDTTFESSHVVEVAPGVRLLRLALVFGANASGKSNLLAAFDYLRNFWFHQPADLYAPTESIPFLLDKVTPQEPTEFGLKFYTAGKKYWYVLVLDTHRVISEKLYFYKSAQPTLLFSRSFENGQSVIRFNPSVIKIDATVSREIALRCLPNMSFFAAKKMINYSLPHINDASDWMRKRTHQIIDPGNTMFDSAGKMALNNDALKKYLVDFMHRADFNITDISAEKYACDVRTYFEHTVKNSRGTEKYILSNELQSLGTQRTFGIETAIYSAILNNEFLPIDEIESSLHPDLTEFILEQFFKSESRSQLLVTTHYDPLLGSVDDLIRKDSVWFTEKGEDGCSDLYSLVEFKGLRKIKSFQKSYRNGAFGAVPNI